MAQSATAPSNIDMRALDTMPVDELARLPPAVLADLQDEVDNALALARKRRAALDDALDRRYGRLAQEMRSKLGKDAGLVRITDAGCAIAADSKRMVYWDQPKLAELRDKIAAGGDDPEVYIVTKTELTVREAAYASWPPSVREAFESARTVRPGKSSYRIERPKDAEAA